MILRAILVYLAFVSAAFAKPVFDPPSEPLVSFFNLGNSASGAAASCGHVTAGYTGIPCSIQLPYLDFAIGRTNTTTMAKWVLGSAHAAGVTAPGASDVTHQVIMGASTDSKTVTTGSGQVFHVTANVTGFGAWFADPSASYGDQVTFAAIDAGGCSHWGTGAFSCVASMTGNITAYDAGAGTMTVNVTSKVGTGTYSNWAIVSHLPPNGTFAPQLGSGTVNGYISGTGLVITSGTGLNQGSILTSGATTDTVVLSQTSGTLGSTGNYTVNTSQTVGSAGSPVAFGYSTPNFNMKFSGSGGSYVHDWDLRGISMLYVEASDMTLSFDQTMFDLANFYKQTSVNSPYFSCNPGAHPILVTNSTMDLTSPVNLSVVFGNCSTTSQNNYVLNAPNDFFDAGGVAGYATSIHNNYVTVTGANNFHPDMFQIHGLFGSSADISNNVLGLENYISSIHVIQQSPAIFQIDSGPLTTNKNLQGGASNGASAGVSEPEGSPVNIMFSSGGALPSGITSNSTAYNLINLSGSPVAGATFQLATTAGGAPISVTTNGSNLYIHEAQSIEFNLDDYLGWNAPTTITNNLVLNPGNSTLNTYGYPLYLIRATSGPVTSLTQPGGAGTTDNLQFSYHTFYEDSSYESSFGIRSGETYWVYGTGVSAVNGNWAAANIVNNTGTNTHTFDLSGSTADISTWQQGCVVTANGTQAQAATTLSVTGLGSCTNLANGQSITSHYGMDKGTTITSFNTGTGAITLSNPLSAAISASSQIYVGGGSFAPLSSGFLNFNNNYFTNYGLGLFYQTGMTMPNASVYNSYDAYSGNAITYQFSAKGTSQPASPTANALNPPCQAPTGLTVSPVVGQNSQLSLSWTQPACVTYTASAGYSASTLATSYQITASPGNVTQLVQSASCSAGTCTATLTGLTAATTYTVYLSAMTAYDDYGTPHLVGTAAGPVTATTVN